MRFISRFINIKGELFSSTFTYGVTAVIKLFSSLILTRLLNPEVYGIVAVLFSVLFVLELLSDVGTVGLIVRHPRGSEPVFIHTVWTVRLLRGVMNFCALYYFAPLFAGIYDMPVLTDALRTFSFMFLIKGLESMSFVLAQRDQRARIGNNAELATNAVMTIVVIGLAVLLKDHYAFIYGILLQRLLMTIVSYFYYRDVGVAFSFDRDALAEQFHFAKFVMPSSMLTIGISQYDRLILLRLFDLSLLGVYGVAGNINGQIAGLVMRNCRVVLYPRCAEYFRSNRTTAAVRYYSENARLILVITLLPAAVAGFSQSIVNILYDSRYAGAGTILMAGGLGTVRSEEHTSELQSL